MRWFHLFCSLVMLLALIMFPGNRAMAGNWRSQMPEGNCAYYALGEFEKIAPQPGVNWVDFNAEHIFRAERSGWAIEFIKTNPFIGAIAYWQPPKHDGGHLAIVRDILPDSIIVQEMNYGKTISKKIAGWYGVVSENWGIVKTRRVYFENFNPTGMSFSGYILPIRKDDYQKNYQKYRSMAMEQQENPKPRYKGFSEYWGPTYALQEFDKVAPSPGVNWQGDETQWKTNARKSGWVIRDDPSLPKEGAIIVRYDLSKMISWIGIVRSIKGNTIKIEERGEDLRVSSYDMDFSKLNTEGFVCYILPEQDK